MYDLHPECLPSFPLHGGCQFKGVIGIYDTAADGQAIKINYFAGLGKLYPGIREFHCGVY